MEGNYLITTDNWFYGPDGKQYRAVYGSVQIVSDEVLGIKTNARSSNWFAKVGTEENHVIIAGCQIHYSIKCNKRPNDGDSIDWNVENGEVKNINKPCQIYFAE